MQGDSTLELCQKEPNGKYNYEELEYPEDSDEEAAYQYDSDEYKCY